MASEPNWRPDILSDELLLAIGAVTANFNTLDMALRVLLCQLVPLPYDRGNIAIKRMSFRHLCEAVEDLSGGPGILEPEKIRAIVKEALQLNELRNTVIHSMWGADSDGAIVRFKAWQRIAQPSSCDDLYELSTRLKKLGSDVFFGIVAPQAEPPAGT